MIANIGGFQPLICSEQFERGAQRLECQGGDLRQHDVACSRFRHPPRDLEIDSVRSADREWDPGTARCPNDFELPTCQRMEWVVNRDFRRQGIVKCCCSMFTSIC